MLWLLLPLATQVAACGGAVRSRNVTVNMTSSDILTSTSCDPSSGSGWVNECISTASWRFTGTAVHYIISSQEFQPVTITIDDISFTTRFDDSLPFPSTESEQPFIWSITGLHNIEHEVLITKDGSHWEEGSFMFTTDEENPTTTTQSLSYPPSSILVSNDLHKRAANPACIKNGTEGSCFNLAAACTQSVTAEESYSPSFTQTTMWGIRPCAAAATCYGVTNLIDSTKCQTRLDISISNQLPLNTSIYHGLAHDCKNKTTDCRVTRQNFVDWFYSSLKQINTTVWPSSSDVVSTAWAGLATFSGTQGSISYAKLNSWYHTACPDPNSCHLPPKRHSLSRGALIGIIITSIVVFAVVVAFVIDRWAKKRRVRNNPPTRPNSQYGLPDSYKIDPRLEDEHPSPGETRPLM